MNKLWGLFLSVSRGKQIGVIVLFAHFALVVFLSGHHWFTKKPALSQRISVHTVHLPQMAKPQVTSKPKAVVSTSNKAKPPAKPALKKPSAEPVKLTPKNKSERVPAVPKKREPKEEAIIDEIAMTLEALGAKLPTFSKERLDLAVPTTPVLNIDSSTLTVEDPIGKEIIAAFLQSALELPEYGDVVAKIEIGPTGELVSCEILDAKSKKNGDFLKNRLPELQFPCFNTATTFTITFRNVENI